MHQATEAQPSAVTQLPVKENRKHRSKSNRYTDLKNEISELKRQNTEIIALLQNSNAIANKALEALVQANNTNREALQALHNISKTTTMYHLSYLV